MPVQCAVQSEHGQRAVGAAARPDAGDDLLRLDGGGDLRQQEGFFA